ncbi:Hypothetical predicted protein, partial [Paramuricea clavata]
NAIDHLKNRKMTSYYINTPEKQNAMKRHVMGTSSMVMYSYWPQLNAKGKAKKAEIPDKELWKKYNIRVLSYTDNFKTAQKRLKKAEETSNVDSESDSDGCERRKRSKPNTPRKRSRPGSYHYAELSECYDDTTSKQHQKVVNSVLRINKTFVLTTLIWTFARDLSFLHFSPDFVNRKPSLFIQDRESHKD